MMGAMIEEMLEVERDDHLGYSKHERKKDTENLRIEEIYGASISAQTISNMTDRILPVVEEWPNRALREIYSILYIAVT